MISALTRRVVLAGLLAAPLFAVPLRAQAPTPEGTVITNTATASWTDANSNTYTPVTASTSVTVGFSTGIDVTSPATATPSSPTTGATLSFTINNIGNGTDSVTVSTTAGTGLTITSYKIGATSYASLAALNLALSGMAINAGTNIVVDVIYDVAAGRGGLTSAISMTATSRRQPGASAGTDVSSTNVTPGVSSGVNVSPDGGTRNRLPSNGTTYTETYTVQNTGNSSDVFNLLASLVPGGTITIVSVNGVAGASASITLASGASQNVDVVYTVANAAAAGTTEQLRLRATSTNNAAINDLGDVTVTVVRAAVAMTKEVYRDNKSTTIAAADRVVPGEYIQYKITVSNTSSVVANSVQVTDPLPGAVAYDSNTPDAAGWTISVSGANLTADLSGSLAAGASRFFWVRVRVR
jgi:uncharacterized repeat protein (TIGR01451 family)